MTGADAPAARRRWTDTWAASALAAAAAAAVVAPSLPGGFVADDRGSIVDDALVRRPGSIGALLAGAFGPDPFGYTRPLRTIEFALDGALFGDGPLPLRVHSLLWHAVAAATLVLVLRRLLGDGHADPAAGVARATRGHGAALVAALLWAVHPAQIEPVAWISARGDVAMGACVLASVLFALKSKGFDRPLAVSLVCMAVATLFKETAVLLPLLVLVLRRTGRCRAPAWPYGAVAAAYLVWRLGFQRAPPAADPGFVLGGSTVGTFATMSRAFGFYVAETLLPAQSFDWYMTPSTSFVDGAAVTWLVVHAALVVSAVATWRRAPLWTISVAWFYAFLLAVANWPVFVGKPTSERYLYLSLAGAALAVGWALVRAPRAAWFGALAVVAAFGAASLDRARMWLGDDAAYAAVVADHDSPGARYYFAHSAFDRAVDVLRRAGSAVDRAGVERARALLETSLDEAHRGIAVWRAYDPSPSTKSVVLRRFEILAARDCHLLGRDDEALFHADEALRIGPTVDGGAEHERALALLGLGFGPQAAAAMRRALSLGFSKDDPEIGPFFRRAGMRCEDDGMPRTAESCYATAVDLSARGAAREAAETRLFDVRGRPRPAVAETDERARIAALDAKLAGLWLDCPARPRPPSR